MRVPLDMTDSKKEKKVYWKDMFIQLFYTLYLIYMEKKVKKMFMEMIFIQLFYTLYLIYMEKKVKQMFMEMICLYNCFIRCI